MAATKATKYYVRRSDGTCFITTAESPHHAVEMLWRHQLEEAKQSGRDTDIAAISIPRAYRVHTGRESESELVPTGRACWAAHRRIGTLVRGLLSMQYGQEEADKILWDSRDGMRVAVRYLTRHQLGEA